MSSRTESATGLLCVGATAFCSTRSICADSLCPIVPTLKEYHDRGRTLTLETSGAAAIVIGTKATEPERYAAEYLQTQIERRFKHKLAIHDEGTVPQSVSQILLPVQVETNACLQRLCNHSEVDLSGNSPGHDGFVIRCLEDGPRQVVLVGGSNPRGVIYGQHAFFDLLRSEGETVVFPSVSVRDWPSIPWRGRPHSVLKQHLVPGALDAYLRARLNFTDVRDDPDVDPTIIFPARKASMGFPAGKPIDRPLVERMIRESHRRGLFVYGTVSCGVPADKTGDVIKTFEELISLGVDGLWISFDDVGAGENAANVVRRVLELGARHNMTGRKIAITPPSGDYQHIDTEFNRQAAGWGLAEAQWLFTRVPCADDLEMVRQIGISGLPGWWHNLVNMRGGFLHNGDVLCPLRKDWGPAYVNPQPLANGWHRPSYEQLRDAEKHANCVLLWGVIGGWPEEYQLGDLGFWAWNPAEYDWQRTCDAAYRLLYGPQQVETAQAFDAKLSALKDLFHLPPWRFWPEGTRSFVGWPCRLRQVEDRPKALVLLDEYVAMWRQRISGMEHWKELVKRRRAKMTERFENLIHGDVASLFPYMEQVDENQLDSLFARLPDPPAGKALAELQAADWLRMTPRFQGAFCVGEFESKTSKFVAVAYPRRIPSKPGDAAEVCAEIAVPDYTGHLRLDAFVNDTRLENRYPGHRSMQLWANDRLIWEEDIAASRAGKEWISSDFTESATAGSPLKLRFRVVDKHGVGDHLSVAFLGPVRLRAVVDETSQPE